MWLCDPPSVWVKERDLQDLGNAHYNDLVLKMLACNYYTVSPIMGYCEWLRNVVHVANAFYHIPHICTLLKTTFKLEERGKVCLKEGIPGFPLSINP